MMKKTAVAQPDAPQSFAVNTELRDLRMLFCQATLGDGITPASIEQNLSIAGGLQVEENVWRYDITTTVKGKPGEPGDKFLISAIHLVLFTGEFPDNFTINQKSDQAMRLAVNLAWPYWRDVVSSTTARLGLPGLRIPFLHGNMLKFAVTAPEKKKTGKVKRKK
jgi:preprotein translocase subunit SecB